MQIGGMNYLIPDDYTSTLQAADITALGVLDPAIAAPAEQLALAEISRELSSFELGSALTLWQLYDAGIPYPAGSRVLLDGTTLIYAVQDAPPGTDPADLTYWITGDNRPKELVEVVLRLTLYHLAGRLGIGPVPVTIADRARDARAWLQAQARGLSPALFPRQSDKAPFQYGGTPARMDGRSIW